MMFHMWLFFLLGWVHAHQATAGLGGYNDTTSLLMQKSWEEWVLVTAVNAQGADRCHQRVDDGGSASAECAAISGAFQLYAKGAMDSRAVRQQIFGKDIKHGRQLPGWTWQCFWHGALAVLVEKESVNGRWRPPGRAPQINIALGSWPSILEGAAWSLLRGNASSNLFVSDAALQAILPAQLKFKGLPDDADTLDLEEWLDPNSPLPPTKTDNTALWRNLSLADDDDFEHPSVLTDTQVRSVLDKDGFQKAMSFDFPTHQLSEITMNWANRGHVRHLPFHSDMAPQITCQVSGQKSWVMMPYEAIAQITSLPELQKGIDFPDKVEFDPFLVNESFRCYPGLKRSMPPPLVVEVKEGDCLILPPLWWHATESFGRSINLIMAFDTLLRHGADVLADPAEWPFREILESGVNLWDQWPTPQARSEL